MGGELTGSAAGGEDNAGEGTAAVGGAVVGLVAGAVVGADVGVLVTVALEGEAAGVVTVGSGDVVGELAGA